MSLRCGAALWAFILLAPAGADAGDYHLQDFPVGNRAMVLGGAFTAVGNDPSGVYYNPAGLVDASRANVSVSASLYGLDRLEVASLGEGSRGFGGPRVTTRYRLVPGEVGAVFTSDWDRQGKRAPLAMAFTVLFPSAGERSLVSTAHRFEDSGFTRVRDTSEAVRTVSDAELWLGAGVGYALNDTFSIGASAFILHRTVSLSSQASWTFRPDDYVDWFQDRDGYQPDLQFYDSVAQLDANDQSFVGVLGAKMRFEPMLVGLQVRLPGIPFRSRAKVSRRLFSTYRPAGQEDVVQAELAEDPSGLRSETRRPMAVRMGAAWVQDKAFTASCDLAYELRSEHRRWYFDDPETEKVFQLPRKIKRKLVTNLACGFELLLRKGLSGAVGVFTDQSSLSDGLTLDGSFSKFDYEGSLAHVEDIDVNGATASIGVFGEHSLTRVGIAVTLGEGYASSYDPWDQNWRVHAVRQSSAYLFVASTFRY